MSLEAYQSEMSDSHDPSIRLPEAPSSPVQESREPLGTLPLSSLVPQISPHEEENVNFPAIEFVQHQAPLLEDPSPSSRIETPPTDIPLPLSPEPHIEFTVPSAPSRVEEGRQTYEYHGSRHSSPPPSARSLFNLPDLEVEDLAKDDDNASLPSDSSGPFLNTQKVKYKVLVVGISGVPPADRQILVRLLVRSFSDVRLMHQSQYAVGAGAEAETMDGLFTQDGLGLASNIERFSAALRGVKQAMVKELTHVETVDREPYFNLGPCIADHVDEESLVDRLRSKTRNLRDVRILVVEGRSLYCFEQLRELIDVKICLLHDEDLPEGPMLGSWYLNVFDNIEGSRSRRRDRLKTVLWKGFQDSHIERIADWLIDLVVTATKETRQGERRIEFDGRYEVCDCGDSFIGKVRRWVYDHV